MTINIIAAMGENRELGLKNDLLCHLPSDLKHFKTLTNGHICIQGRKTYQSIVDKLGKPLPNRLNVVLTKDKKFKPNFPGVIVYNSVEEILHEYQNYGNSEPDIFICGGGEIYKQFLPYADYLLLTIIHGKFKADTFFPEIDLSEWEVVTNIECKADEDNEYDHSFLIYKHRK